ncbi:hypothetical protein [Rhodanobacter terrae]|uniref:Uncharacterized protein n=1 Tax=Rhodanobacter terrae TaxID=418647 RepID=A0ABW0T1T6_9GAMM
MQAEVQGVQPMFARLAAESADAARIAEIAVSIWDDVGEALAPIIGQSGVGALFRRSIYLTRIAHPCLQVVDERALASGGLAVLQTVLAQQDSTEAAAVNAALLQNFQEVLITLIGASLTSRLLRPVWEITSSGDAAQEKIL